MHLNILKAQQNGFVTDLKPGDKVRIDDTSFHFPEAEYLPLLRNSLKLVVCLIHHYLKRELRAVGVMKYTWYNQPLESQ
jgi:hypothetical protein